VVHGDNTPKVKGSGIISIKIWSEDANGEDSVYDNGMHQPIGGGSIVIRTNK